MKRTVAYAVLLLVPFARAAEPKESAIRAAVEMHIDAREISGAVTVVAARDKVLAVDTIGLADVASKKPMGSSGDRWNNHRTLADNLL